MILVFVQLGDMVVSMSFLFFSFLYPKETLLPLPLFPGCRRRRFFFLFDCRLFLLGWGGGGLLSLLAPHLVVLSAMPAMGGDMHMFIFSRLTLYVFFLLAWVENVPVFRCCTCSFPPSFLVSPQAKKLFGYFESSEKCFWLTDLLANFFSSLCAVLNTRM